MLNFSKFFVWLKSNAVAAFDEKYFLYVVGSIFLLGIIGKCIVVANYKRLIRGADNLKNADNAVFRQIKMRMDSVKDVNGMIVKPEALIERQLNRCKVVKISMSSLDNLIHWCATFILAWSVVELMIGGEIIKMIIGTGIAFVLEGISISFDVERLRKELKTILIDYIENNGVEKKRELEETLSETKLEEDENRKQEIILNQVIGEFLQ